MVDISMAASSVFKYRTVMGTTWRTAHVRAYWHCSYVSMLVAIHMMDMLGMRQECVHVLLYGSQRGCCGEEVQDTSDWLHAR